MSKSRDNHMFPWGVYIGDLLNSKDSIPIYLPSDKGGFNIFFDHESETDANKLIENISLKLFELLPISDIKAEIFDFSYKKRFIELSLLKDIGLYHISLTPDEANERFYQLEKVSLYRHHELLTPKIENISKYNQLNNKIENYYLLIINLDHIKNLFSPQKIKEFLDSAYEVGFYTILFAHKDILEDKDDPIQYILNKFPTLELKKGELLFSKKTFEFYDLTQQFQFKYLDDDRNYIATNIIKKYKGNEK